MNVLLLVPEPFYQERGTPIAVDRMLKVLSSRADKVDVITYHEGSDVHYDHITIRRTPHLPFLRNIRPGYSWKKVICDLLMTVKAIRLASRKRYHVVHAVEESVFIAMVLKVLFKIPYVYDMDSSLAQQMVERYPPLARISLVFDALERLVVRNAKTVVPVCDALGAAIEKYKPERVLILRDVSLLEERPGQVGEDLRAALGIEGTLLMYVGNLQAYQGIDLLLESFALALKRGCSADLVIIGGEAADIRKYEEKASLLGIHHRVHLLGPRPVDCLADYLRQADVLVSPRVLGTNTPMKVYSYLASGRAVLATDLPTHTQLFDSRVAVLAKPTPEMFARGMLLLLEDESLRLRLGMASKKLSEERFSSFAFTKSFNSLYEGLQAEIEDRQGVMADVKVSTRLGR